MKVLIADKFEKAGIDGLRRLGVEVLSEPAAGAEGLPALLKQYDPQVLIVRSTKVQRPAIEAANNLKLIVRAGSGVDNIDVPAASAKKIAVCNCPGMNAVAVAELTMALLLCCDRRVPDQCATLRGGTWNKKEFSKAKGLKGMTLGVLGAGAIGREVIKRARAFDMHILIWSLHMTPEAARDLGCVYMGHTREELLAMTPQCDALSVHIPLDDSTKKFFNKQFFDAVKPGAYFLNTSRGGVVDEAALREAIQSKHIRAGLDVYEGQPAETESAWKCTTANLPGVYTSHHCGASTDQAQLAVAEEAVRIVQNFKETGETPNCVNAEAVSTRR
jgi:D-3-phosphoglycerate dehydrogenase